ncbi:hypothetical protein EV121DRAFT_297779, partial [Schizophyllum commune]
PRPETLADEDRLTALLDLPRFKLAGLPQKRADRLTYDQLLQENDQLRDVLDKALYQIQRDYAISKLSMRENGRLRQLLYSKNNKSKKKLTNAYARHMTSKENMEALAVEEWMSLMKVVFDSDEWKQMKADTKARWKRLKAAEKDAAKAEADAAKAEDRRKKAEKKRIEEEEKAMRKEERATKAKAKQDEQKRKAEAKAAKKAETAWKNTQKELAAEERRRAKQHAAKGATPKKRRAPAPRRKSVRFKSPSPSTSELDVLDSPWTAHNGDSDDDSTSSYSPPPSPSPLPSIIPPARPAPAPRPRPRPRPHPQSQQPRLELPGAPPAHSAPATGPEEREDQFSDVGTSPPSDDTLGVVAGVGINRPEDAVDEDNAAARIELAGAAVDDEVDASGAGPSVPVRRSTRSRTAVTR